MNCIWTVDFIENFGHINDIMNTQKFQHFRGPAMSTTECDALNTKRYDLRTSILISIAKQSEQLLLFYFI